MEGRPMRDRVIRLRASAQEAARMRDLARSRGMSLSDMVRRAALDVRMPARTFDQTHASLLARILGELGRVGGNINQLTRRANPSLTPHPSDDDLTKPKTPAI
jgi:hypothetical protein